MSEMSKFFEEYKNTILLSIHTLAPARVISYDAITKRANLQPLFFTSDKNDTLYKQSPINDIPIPKHCQSDIEPGALVFYIPAQRSLAEMDGAKFIDPDSHDFFSAVDAVVVGVFDG